MTARPAAGHTPTPDDDLPGMLALAKGVAEQKWPHTIDAKVWATEWAKTIAEHPTIPTDEATMLGWFANAIMAGYDTASMHASKQNAALVAALRDLTREASRMHDIADLIPDEFAEAVKQARAALAAAEKN